MKATLEFTLPEDSLAHMEAVRTGEAWECLREIDRYARGYLKHGLPTGKTWEDVVQDFRDNIARLGIPE